MDAQTLAKTIKRRTKRGEWWTWRGLGLSSRSGNAGPVTLLSWGWLQRRSLVQDDPLRAVNGAEFAYRWTETRVSRV